MRPLRPRFASALLVIAVLVGPAGAQSTPSTAPAAKGKEPPRHARMDYGSLISCTLDVRQPPGNWAYKALVIRVSQDPPATMAFDTDTLRWAGGWAGPLNLQGVVFDGRHGPNPSPAGEVIFAVRPGPGWARNGQWTDPRPPAPAPAPPPGAASAPASASTPGFPPYGPLPADWAKYKGLYRHGEQVVVSYTVGQTPVLELPGARTVDGRLLLTRTLQVGAGDTPLTLAVADVPDATGVVCPPGAVTGTATSGAADANVAVLTAGAAGGPAAATAAGLAGAPAGAAWSIADGGRIALTFPPRTAPVRCTLVLWRGPPEQLPAFAAALKTVPAPSDLDALCKGGPAQWAQPVATQGRLGTGKPYVVDTLTVPFENPWNSWMRLAGHDFFADGRAAVCTWSGDVWLVSGIDDKLDKLTWKRHAAGLFQALGVRIVDDRLYVLGRDQITRLHDLNGDGEADFYENFNNDCEVSAGFHEFALDLQTDPQGNFYYAKGGPVRPGGRGWQEISAHAGSVIQVSRDGSTLTRFARGIRAPNGMSASPTGVITVADNQGTWTPVCRLDIVTRDLFIGVPDLAHADPRPTACNPPVCWFPMDVDNSSGGGTWVNTDRWGPFKGHMLHTSYGKCSLFVVLMETVNGVVQGGVYRFPLSFESGIMRARFNPRDQQLYVTGLKGWQTNAALDGCFQRVRYTGDPVYMPSALRVTQGGVELRFTQPLAKSAADPQNFGVSHWNYVWSSAYGSPEVAPAGAASQPPEVEEVAPPAPTAAPSTPDAVAELAGETPRAAKPPARAPGRKAEPRKKSGRTPLTVQSVTLSADGQSVFLSIPGIQPVMQMRIEFNLAAEDGTPITGDVHNTIHHLSPTTGARN